MCWAAQQVNQPKTGNAVQVWEAMTGRPLLTTQQFSLRGALAWSPDGTRIASGGDDSTVQVWQAV